MFEVGDLVELNHEVNTPWFRNMLPPFRVIEVTQEVGDTFLSIEDQRGMVELGWLSMRFRKVESAPEEPVVQWWLEE